MKFAIVGAGGVGGFFGGKLARGGEEVWFLARGAHLTALRTNGLQINSTEGSWTIPPGRMTDDPRQIGPTDVIFFCVKSYDTEKAAASLEPMLTNETSVISFQNGVDNEQKILGIIPRGHVMGGVAFIYSTITSPGVVTETGGIKKLTFGLLRENPHQRDKAKEILDRLTRSGINATLAEDITVELWKKFIFIAAVGGMTALTRLTLGEILAVNETRAMLSDAMRETAALAHAKGVHVPDGFIDFVFETLNRLDNNSRSSLYHDLVHGKPLEIEALSGSVVRYGKELGIPTPVHRAIYSALLPHHRKHESGDA